MAARFNEQHGDVGCARPAMSGGSGPKRVIHNPGGRTPLPFVACVCA